jgi:hypothetical protein
MVLLLWNYALCSGLVGFVVGIVSLLEFFFLLHFFKATKGGVRGFCTQNFFSVAFSGIYGISGSSIFFKNMRKICEKLLKKKFVFFFIILKQ